MKLIRLILAFTIVVTTGSCSVGDTDISTDTSGGSATPPVVIFGDVDLDIVAYQESTVTALERALSVTLGSGAITIDEVRVSVDDIDLKPADDEGDDLDLEGPFISRLVSNGTIVNETFPALASISIPEGVYERVRYKLKAVDPEDIPDDFSDDPLVTDILPDNSIVIEGDFPETSGNDINGNGIADNVPFRFITNRDTRVEITSSTGLTVTSGQAQYLYIAFNVELWFDDILPLLQALSSPELTGGVMEINDQADGAAAEIAELIEDNIVASSRFANDDDGDFDEEDDIDDDSSSGETTDEESADAESTDDSEDNAAAEAETDADDDDNSGSGN